ncbi:MAG: SGNH/GDSL hydrolase family protein [Myxococcaceae bacterium]
MRRVLLLLVVGCGPAVSVTPARGSSFGHYPVVVKADALKGVREPLSATVGGIAAYDVHRIDDETVSMVVQGHPAAGKQPIVISGHGVPVPAGELEYLPPLDARFQSLVAFGASLTMGSQDASVGRHSQLAGPSALIAKQAGAYLGLPLFKEGFMASVQATDYDATTCKLKSGDIFAGLGTRVQNELLPKITDQDGNVLLWKMREDPDLVSSDVAIGGERITSVVGHAPDLLGMVLEHVVWDPRAQGNALVNPPMATQLDRVKALKPTVLFASDLIVNDYNNVDLTGAGIPDLSTVTSEAEFTTALDDVLATADATGADVFLATGPDITVLPRYSDKVAALKAAGFSDADATSWVTELSAKIDRFNLILMQQTASHPKVHVVDMHQKVIDIEANGADVGGDHLTIDPLHGLLSLDSMHFSDTGYALLANGFIDEMNKVLGTNIPEVDAAAVHAEDPYSVPQLRMSGLPCAGQ